MVALPRLLIAAPSTGAGKTTIATGLMAALRARGLAVSGHKVGPDYIDPGYHALATGRPGRNLDPHLVGEHRIVPLLLHGARDADVAVIEGVMGLHDGRIGGDGFASSGHVARLTSTPVVLVLDVARASRSVAAVAAGVAGFDPGVRVAGVVLNRAGSDRNVTEIRRALEGTGLPVLGVLPRDERLAAPSRHLGLVPAAERTESARTIDLLGEQVAARLDLDALLAVAAAAPGLDGVPWDPVDEVRAAGAGGATGANGVAGPAGAGRPVVAMAGGRAFTFRYAETEELLRAAGCEVVTFDPLTDAALPPGTRGVYLGGGFPEVYAAELARNRPLLAELRDAVGDGVPTVAECAGLLYLADSLDGVPMAGALPSNHGVRAAMSPSLTLRYPEAAATADSLLGRAGEGVTGHEFHRTRTDPVAGDRPAWTIHGAATGFAGDSWHASYLHVHWAGYPALAQRFADAVHEGGEWTPLSRRTEGRRSGGRRDPVSRPEPGGESPALVRPGRTEDRHSGGRRDPVSRPEAGSESHALVRPGRPSAERSVGSGREAGGAVRGSAGSSRDVVVAPVDPVGPARTSTDPLRHHGDAETGPGLLDLAVNVYPGARPTWLDEALHAAVDAAAAYPDAAPAREALAVRHGLGKDRVLPTAGAAETFILLAQLPWRNPVVVQPQFTEPQAALERAGYRVGDAFCPADRGFVLEPDAIPEDADLVVVGNPTNPTGVLHSASALVGLCRPGRLVVVDEAFMDAVPGEPESLAAGRVDGLVVVRSLTKQWSIPGIRAGYVTGDPAVVDRLRALQPPWSVSGAAIAAILACSTVEAAAESQRRARNLAEWRRGLTAELTTRGIEFVPSAAPFVLARPGVGVHARLRAAGIAVRRADTFPGLDGSWVRIAVRPPAVTDRLLNALDRLAIGRSG